MLRPTLLSFLLLGALGCASTPSEAPALGAEVAQKHGVSAWQSKRAVQATIKVAFGNKPPLEGVLRFTPATDKVRLELKDGTLLVFDGERAWSSPAAFPRARFHLLTWPYFLAAPFKLQDPGSRFVPVGRHALKAGQSPQRVGRLTFGEGVGDTPDDWYDVYVSDQGQLDALGYIVTYGKDAEAASKAPHACVYSDFVELEGVRLATKWKFYDWTREGGLQGKAIGLVELSELRFVTPTSSDFAKPAGAIEDALPK